MNKIKISSGLASVMLVACLFAGWQTLLLVTLLMFVFADVEDKVKGTAIKVIAFYVALILVSTGWDLIVSGYGVVYSSITDLVMLINNWFNASLDLSGLYQYALTPINSLLDIADTLVGYAFSLIKFFFILAVLGNKPMKQLPLVKTVNDFVAKVVTYINSIEVPAPVAPVAAAPVAPAAPAAPEAPVQQ